MLTPSMLIVGQRMGPRSSGNNRCCAMTLAIQVVEPFFPAWNPLPSPSPVPRGQACSLFGQPVLAHGLESFRKLSCVLIDAVAPGLGVGWPAAAARRWRLSIPGSSSMSAAPCAERPGCSPPAARASVLGRRVVTCRSVLPVGLDHAAQHPRHALKRLAQALADRATCSSPGCHQRVDRTPPVHQVRPVPRIASRPVRRGRFTLLWRSGVTRSLRHRAAASAAKREQTNCARSRGRSDRARTAVAGDRAPPTEDRPLPGVAVPIEPCCRGGARSRIGRKQWLRPTGIGQRQHVEPIGEWAKAFRWLCTRWHRPRR